MAQKDYYATLGLTKGATDEEIKKAHIKLAKQYHPDLNHEPGAQEKFKEIQEAYDVLSDPQKKANYDKYGTAEPNQGFGGFGGFEGGFSTGFEDLGDIFSSFFGGGTRRQSNGPQKGQDMQKRMSISLNDVIFGRKAKISVPVYDTCPHCHGTGAESNSDIVTCPRCNGRGQILETVNTIFGQTQSRRACPDCNGTGKYIKNKCSVCRGDGKIKSTKDIEVEVPVGIQTGQQIRLSGYGGKGYNGGPNGDLYIQFVVKDDPLYSRDGDDLRADLKISFADALLGSVKDIQTPYGIAEMSIPSGTQTGTTFRLRGKGVPNIRTKVKGDMYIKVNIETPRNFTQNQKDLIREAFGLDNSKNKKKR